MLASKAKINVFMRFFFRKRNNSQWACRLKKKKTSKNFKEEIYLLHYLLLFSLYHVMCRKKGDAAALFKTDKAERAKNKNGTTTLWVVSQVTTCVRVAKI